MRRRHYDDDDDDDYEAARQARFAEVALAKAEVVGPLTAGRGAPADALAGVAKSRSTTRWLAAFGWKRFAVSHLGKDARGTGHARIARSLLMPMFAWLRELLARFDLKRREPQPDRCFPTPVSTAVVAAGAVHLPT